ncbi:MAG: oxidoreductase [Gammaproteobacteria bacterium]|nr:oxidoreductase [Gammaproteobacteria bacterium]
MKKWNLIVDVAECHNCQNCVIACHDEHVGNDIPGYAAPQPPEGHSWIRVQSRERGRAPLLDTAHLPTMCNQCDAAPCVTAGRGAVHQRPDGIVIIDPVAARGRRDLVDACPYGAIWWNEALQLPQKWIFDAHLLDRGWSVPRCVQSCPTGALRALKVTDSEMQSVAAAEGLEVLQPELGARPRVYYRNLYRYAACFIGGCVSGLRAGVDECLAGAGVELSRGGAAHAQALTDAFGEFKFDGLPPGSGAWTLRLRCAGFRDLELQVELASESLVLEQIVLQPSGGS